MLEDELPDDEAYDAADPEAVNKARKRAVRLHKKRVDFVKAMMDMHEGRMWLFDVLNMCHMAENTHTPGDTHTTAFKNGERNIGLKILADISEANPDRYMLMLTEGKDEK